MDRLRIATLRLTDAAKMFYNGCTELHEENVNWEDFKSAFLGDLEIYTPTNIIL
jgi:hypothetical protein